MLKRSDDGGPFRWPKPSVNRITAVMGACGFVLIVGTSSFIALHERDIAVREARVSARSATFSLADHASRLFEVADLALRTVMLSVGARPWEEAAQSEALWAEMRMTSDALPYIRDLLLVDAEGQLRLGTMAFPTPGTSLADRPAFVAARAGASGLILGGPIVGRITGLPSFLVARRLSAGDGSFRGMVSATADLSYFVTYWQSLALQHEAHVALVRSDDGKVLVRLPESSTPAAAVSSLREAIAADPNAGLYRPAPGRLGFYQRVGDLPLVLTVSYRETAVEETWLSWLWLFILYPALATAALVGFMALVRRQSRIEARANREVYRARAALAAANGQLERRVAERTAELRESSAEIQRFAYIVSHDLRAPLVNIMGFTSELERLRGDIFPESRPLPPVVREDFDEAIGFIKSSIDKMDRLIKAILLLARQGTRVFTPEPVDMAALMQSIVDGVAHRAQSAGATVTVGPMPILVIDRIAVEQVFSNLLDNAVKYLQADVSGRIAITAETRQGRVAFCVADNGRGIDPRDHARVFELFRRSGAQDRPGEGIGLAHVKTLVRQLGGTITLDSEPGRGCTFTVVLPLEPYGAAA